MINSEKYIDDVKDLSLTARVCVAVLIFEKYCIDKQLIDSQIDEFINYIWEWPLINDPDQFVTWEQRKVELVNYGLGEDCSPEFKDKLKEADIDEIVFRSFVSSIVEILWGSFWGAAENNQSFESFIKVMKYGNLSTFPVLTPFKFSKFCDGDGWGINLNKIDRDFWRNQVLYI
jgi:hypothetical protein